MYSSEKGTLNHIYIHAGAASLAGYIKQLCGKFSFAWKLLSDETLLNDGYSMTQRLCDSMSIGR